MKYCIFPVTHYQQNCSIVWCDKTNKAAVIDPGGDIPQLRNKIAQLGVSVEKILLTHGHMDHCGGSAELCQQLQVPIEGPHKDDMFWIGGLDAQAQSMGFSRVDAFMPTRWLVNGDTVVVGDETLEVLHCPGHTPGHVVFYHRQSRRAFVGDVIFQGSIGRTDFPMSDHQKLLNAIRGRLFPLGDDVAFVPGHGPESTFGEERQSNAFVADHRFG